MDDHFDDDIEEEAPRPWLVWQDAGTGSVEWTDIPIFVFKALEEAGTSFARVAGFACDLFKAHANERSRRRYVRDEMTRELEQIVSGGE